MTRSNESGSAAAVGEDLDALLSIARHSHDEDHDDRTQQELADDLIRFRHALDLLELRFASDAARFAALALLARTERFVRESPGGAAPFDESALLEKAEAHTLHRFRNDCDHVRHAADQHAFLDEHLDIVEFRRLELFESGPGGLSLRGFLDSVAGATLRTALEPLAAPMGADDDRSRGRRLADALVELASHCLDTDWPCPAEAQPPAADAPPAAGTAAANMPAAGLPEAFTALGTPLPPGAPTPQGSPPASGSSDPPSTPGASATRPVRVRRPHLQVTAALETLLGLDGASAGELDFSPPIAAATVQRLACDASVTRVLLGPDSTVVDVGRARRVPAPSTRTALALRDKGCTWPGCDRPASWTEAHHLRHWARHGVTELPNLVLVWGLLPKGVTGR